MNTWLVDLINCVAGIRGTYSSTRAYVANITYLLASYAVEYTPILFCVSLIVMAFKTGIR